jgi:hypothetical protein
MSGFTEFHMEAWKAAVEFSKNTGCHIMIDVDEHTLNQYMLHFNSNGFTTPQRAAIRPQKNRWYLLAPKTLDTYLASRSGVIGDVEDELDTLKKAHYTVCGTFLGKLALKWLSFKDKILKRIR